MNSYLLLYKGPSTPTGTSHDKWPIWFAKKGDRLIDTGSPLTTGRSLHGDRSTTASVVPVNGYSIIQAEDMDEALSLLIDHPYLSLGDEYTVEVFDLR